MNGPVPSCCRGTCFGYGVRSELGLRYLREGDGDPLEIVDGGSFDSPPGELLREWRPPVYPTHVRLHGADAGFRLWFEDGGWIGVEPHVPRIIVPAGSDLLRVEERLWGLPILLCFLERGDVPLHASCVEVGGRALLLAGPSGFGKTTLAAAFAEAGHRLLSEDLSCLRPGDPWKVVPGPAMLRIRTDVAHVVRPSGVRELRRDGERVHWALEVGRGTCDPVPLVGMVLLNVDDTDPRLEPATGAEVIRSLWAVSFNLPTDEDRARSFTAVAELAAAIPTWSLTRRLAPDALRPTIECLLGAVGQVGR